MNGHSAVADTRDKRDVLIEAAMRLFGERGFHGTAVPLIAEAASVGAGTIYRYFESKEQLVNAVFQTYKGRLLQAVLDDFPFAGPARAQFHAYWSRTMAFARSHREAMLFLELHHHGPYLDEQSRALEQNIRDLAASYLEAARAQQIVKDLPCELLIAIVHGAFTGLVKEAALGKIELTPETISAGEECCWHAIRR